MENIIVSGMKVKTNVVVDLDKLMFLGKDSEDIADMVNYAPSNYFVIELPHRNGLVYVHKKTLMKDTELTIKASKIKIGSIIGKNGCNIKLILEQIRSSYPKSAIKKINIEEV